MRLHLPAIIAAFIMMLALPAVSRADHAAPADTKLTAVVVAVADDQTSFTVDSGSCPDAKAVVTVSEQTTISRRAADGTITTATFADINVGERVIVTGTMTGEQQPYTLKADSVLVGQLPAPNHPEKQRPAFHPGFLNRVWTVDASVSSYLDGTLAVTVQRFLRVPRKFRAQDDLLVDRDMLVLLNASTRVWKDGRRVPADSIAAGFDAGADVRVDGKVLAPRFWQKNTDGTWTPTFRAKKIRIG